MIVECCDGSYKAEYYEEYVADNDPRDFEEFVEDHDNTLRSIAERVAREECPEPPLVC